MTWEIKQGDWVERLREMPDESVHCCVTSPPYWGLRDYGTARWEGGLPDCDHIAGRFSRGGLSAKQASNSGSNGDEAFRSNCGKCGAIRIDRQLGLERTPEEYIAKMVEGFREVRRVLRKDGTLWLNLGDSYNAHPGQRTVHDKAGYKQSTNRGSCEAASRNTPGMKAKDLVGIPWMLAFALRADGWWLRSDIIWAKPNPMPESVTDRPTKAHEYIFLLTKSERYFYDAEAIAEKANWPEGSWARSKCYDGDETGKLRSFYGNGSRWEGGESRNKRSVWGVATQPFPEAHFATFPPKLVEPCILAGSPEGGTVLDPFAGAGTTGLVALRYHRNFIGIELKREYCEMARRRIEQDAPLFNSVGEFNRRAQG